ncbi:helix-turn-helix domain-containing protein [Streptomyces sp. NPDC054766]
MVTSELAAAEAGVTSATIRKWVQRGHLRPAGAQGRRRLYRLEDVFAAERTTNRLRGNR